MQGGFGVLHPINCVYRIGLGLSDQLMQQLNLYFGCLLLFALLACDTLIAYRLVWKK